MTSAFTVSNAAGGTSQTSRWEEARARFPVADRYIYFNHAAVAPLSLNVAEEILRWTRRFQDEGIVCQGEFLQYAEATRERAARLLGADASEVAFVKNTTQGILLASEGIRWTPGDNVLLPEKEFPANVYPWLNLKRKGVEVRFVPLANGRISAEELSDHMDNRTRAVSVSAVSFLNGFRRDLKRMGALCRDRGAVFIVDAIQALGAVPINVKESLIDVLSADAHKWLLGPQGAGIAYISSNVLDKIDVAALGWNSMTRAGDYLDYSVRLKENAARFEEGTLNALGIAGLRAALDMILTYGVEEIENRILDLTGQLADGLSARGYTIQSPMGPGERSGILSFVHRAISTQEVFARLMKADVVCAQRDGTLRVSPHMYNNSADIDTFLTSLP